MPLIRAPQRAKLEALISNPSTGFNPAYAAMRALYITAGFNPGAITINFSPGTGQFFQGYLSSDAIDVSQLVNPPAFCLYTSLSNSRDADSEKYRIFSGTVIGHLDFYYKRLDGVEVDDTEDTMDCVEDTIAALTATPGTPDWSGGTYFGSYSCSRDPLIEFGDGYAQRLPFQFAFRVDG